MAFSRRAFLGGLFAAAASAALPRLPERKWRQVLYTLPPPMPSRSVTIVDLSTHPTTSKLISFRTNGTEKAYVDSQGQWHFREVA